MLRLLDVSRARWNCLWRRTWGVKTTKRGCNSSLTTVLNTLWYVCSTILFCKLLFYWIEYDDYSFYFQETYNSRSRERYGDLWMKVGSSGGPNKNRVYGLSNTTAENLRAARSVSTVGSSQSVSSTQSKKFVALQQHTAQLTEKYDHLSGEYAQLKVEHAQQKAEYAQQKTDHEQLREMVMNKASHRVVIHVSLILFGRITTSLLLLLLQLHLYINL